MQRIEEGDVHRVIVYRVDRLTRKLADLSRLAAFFERHRVGLTIVAGPIADRMGIRRFMVVTLLLIVPIAVSFLLVNKAMAVVVLGILGFVLVSTFTVSVVLGQAYMPRNPGMASGMIVGFAIGAGGLGVTGLGWLADRFGLSAALWVSALMPLVGFAAALFLPEPRPHR